MNFDRLLRSAQHPDFLVVQIGANDGVKGDPIHAYLTEFRWQGVLLEPLPDVFERLQATYAGHDRLRLVQAALWDTDGPTPFYRHPKWDDCSGLAPVTRLQKKTAMLPITVPGITWPTLCREQAITRIDLLQIDVEGFDWQIVRRTNLVPRPRIIRMEYKNLPPTDRAEALSVLPAAGYRLAFEGKDLIAST